MKKGIFVYLGIFSMLIAGAASLIAKQDFKQAKADGDTVAVTLNFNSLRSDSGDSNVINLRFTPENDIPKGWNVAPITQVSRDAFWLNGVPTQSDGNAVIQKLDNYAYQICIDQIKWSKYHDLVKADDTILVQGKWQAVYESTTFDITVTPIYFQYTGSGWVKLDTYDIVLNFSIDQGRKTNKNELYLRPDIENPVPPDVGWHNRLSSASNDCLALNGVSASKATQLIKVLEYAYLVYLPDAGFDVATDDIVTLQGEYRYSTPLLVFHVHITSISVQWNGSEWGLTMEDASFDDLPANSLLRNLGKYKATGASGTAIKGLDQTPETLLYRRDTNGNVGYLFTQSTAASTCEFRFYLDDNDYYGELYGQAVRSVSFDYMITNTATCTGTEAGASLSPTGELISKDSNPDKAYMVQFVSKNRVNYYCFDLDLVADGKLHTCTLNIAFSDVTGFNFKVFGFFGSFFISNLVADYDAYNQALNDLVVDGLRMYSYKTDSNDCLTYYADAKAAYLALSGSDKGTFANNASYASARARLAAWAAANGDVLDLENGTIAEGARFIQLGNHNSVNTIIIAIAFASSSIIALCVLFTLRKRRKHN